MVPCKIRWTIAPEYRTRFTPSVLDALAARQLSARETVVRELPNRRVSLVQPTRTDLPALYLKEYRIPLTKPFRALLQPYGFHEWRMALALRQREIPTFVPIALGVLRSYGVYRKVFFLTEAIPDSLTLKEYIDRYGPTGENGVFQPGSDLIDQFAAFAAQMRNAGIVHKDLHWGNILIQHPAGGVARFFLIDLHQVRLMPVRAEQEGLSNLALLSAALWGRVPSRTQLSFLKAYCKHLLFERNLFLQLRDAVKQHRSVLLRKTWNKKAARCCQENKYFKKISFKNHRGSARRDCPEDVLRLMEKPSLLFAHPASILLKSGRTTASLILSSGKPAAEIYVKRYNRKNLWTVIKNTLRGSRSRRVWQAAHALITRGIPTPVPLLYLEEHHWGVISQNYYVTRPVKHACTLEMFVAKNFQHMGRTAKVGFIKMVAQTLRTMHDRGVQHGDLKAKNILIEEAGQKGWNLSFVDLDAVRIKQRLSLHDRCRDLARLNCSFFYTPCITATFRLVFLKTYLGAVKRKDLQAAWQTTLQLTQRKLQKHYGIRICSSKRNTAPQAKLQSHKKEVARSAKSLS